MNVDEVIEWAEELTTYHKPMVGELAAIAAIREAAQDFLVAIVIRCPPGPDRSAAIRLVREAMMTANAAIVVPDVKVPV